MIEGPSWARRTERDGGKATKITRDVYFEEFRSLASLVIPYEAIKVEKPTSEQSPPHTLVENSGLKSKYVNWEIKE